MRMALTILAILITPAAHAGSIDSLVWMTGTWRATIEGTEMEETWSGSEGGLMLGMHKDIMSDGRTWFEFLRIESSDGALWFKAQPRGSSPTSFRLKEAGDQRVVFENLEHDFPQRIIYWRSNDQLCARVEGTVDEKLRAQEWCWGKQGRVKSEE